MTTGRDAGPPQAVEPGTLRASFNPLIRPYLLLYVAMVMLATVVFIPLLLPWFLGVGQWWSKHYFDLLECELSPTRLRFRKGIFLQVEKTVPLENIQDVTFIEGPLLRYFHLSILKFETAGQSAGQANSMSLVGIVDAANYRAEILARREALKRELQGRVSDRGGDGERAELLAEVRSVRARLDEIAGLLRSRGP